MGFKRSWVQIPPARPASHPAFAVHRIVESSPCGNAAHAEARRRGGIFLEDGVIGWGILARAKAQGRKGRAGFLFGRQKGRKGWRRARGFLLSGFAAWRLGARFLAGGVTGLVLTRNFIQNVMISRLFREPEILHDVVRRLFWESKIMADASATFSGAENPA